MTMGNVTLSTSSGSNTYRLMGAMSLGGGEPAWNVIDRMKRQPVSAWNGRALYTVELPLILDGWARQQSVESLLDWLRGLLAAPNDLRTAIPREVHISGTGLVRIPNKDILEMDFVAASLDVDAGSVIRGEDGSLLRCSAVLTLQEYVAPPNVKITESFTDAAKQKRIYKIVIRKGDNRSKIKARARKGVIRNAVKHYLRTTPALSTDAKVRALKPGTVFKVKY